MLFNAFFAADRFFTRQLDNRQKRLFEPCGPKPPPAEARSHERTLRSLRPAPLLKAVSDRISKIFLRFVFRFRIYSLSLWPLRGRISTSFIGHPSGLHKAEPERWVLRKDRLSVGTEKRAEGWEPVLYGTEEPAGKSLNHETG